MDLGQVPLPGRASAVGRAVEAAVVEQDKTAVTGRLHVEFHEVGPSRIAFSSAGMVFSGAYREAPRW